MLLDLFWRSALLLAVTALINGVALRRSSAARRHFVWLLTFAALLVLPLLQAAVRWMPSFAPAPIAVAGGLPRVARTVIEVTAGEPSPVPWKPATVLWLAGAALLLGRAWRGQFVAARIGWRARASREEGVALSTEIGVPMVCGLIRPLVVLPAEAEAWPRAQWESAVAHEREHVRRKDTMSQALAQAACALYWPQPLVWLAAAALRRECEQAADDGVLVHQGTPASSYAGHLVDIARALADSRRAAPEGGLAMTRTSQLHRRVAALLDPRTDRRQPNAGFARFAASLSLAAVLAVAALPEVAWGQAAGTLAGVVREPSGAVVPKVRVDLQAKEIHEVVYTNPAGEFAFENVADGSYDLTVSAPGFARMAQSGVRFERAQSGKPLQLTLQMGGISERMTVEGAAPVGPAPQTRAPGAAPTRIRVGGNVQAAKLLEKVRPEYPATAKMDRVEGTVLLNAVIGTDGAIVNLEPINKQVDARLVESATRAVRQWRYSPTLLNGVPVEVTTVVEINFTLAK